MNEPRNAPDAPPDNASIQSALDALAAGGGGVLDVQPGVYEMRDSLHLRSGVIVRGAGPGVVLRKAPMVQSALSADLGYGHYDISLSEPYLFAPGMGVIIRDDNALPADRQDIETLGDPNAVSTRLPDAPLAAGPDTAPPGAARHLSAQGED